MKYVNKDNVIDIIVNSADIQEAKSCVFMLENADVIERSEYIESQKEVLRLGDLFHKANQNAMKCEEEYRKLRTKYKQLNEEANALSKAYQEEHEKYKQLRLNVDKAIERMEIEYNNLDYDANKVLGASYGIRKSINILKRNIGE